MSGMDVCHVVNKVQDTSAPADIATAQCDQDGIGTVGILAWFSAEPFEGDDIVEIDCLEAPRGKFRITRSQYNAVKEVLSEYDVVHTHHKHSGFYAKLVARRLGKPIVVTDHNNHRGFTLKGRIADAVTNIFADRVVCVSESVHDSFSWWESILTNKRKVEVIYNGANIDRIEAAKSLDWSIYEAVEVDSDSVVVGTAGMLVEQKAHDVLIEAVDRANRESEVPIELVMSGDGNLREDLEEQIAQSEHTDRLHLLGYLEERDQVYKMMHEIDIYAMPSLWEGFCVAALEAMVADNACVFSDIPEFWKPFESVARFHSVGDSEGLSREILSLVENDGERRRLARDASELVTKDYTIEKTASQYVGIYDGLGTE